MKQYNKLDRCNDKHLEVYDAITIQLKAALWECCPPTFINSVATDSLLQSIKHELVEDATSFSTKDPAATGDVMRVVQAYTSFRAVLHYRLAHRLDREIKENSLNNGENIYPALISSRGKLLSGAELHHLCYIGQRFILDHGVGTVFGETAQLGDDCYVLGGVTLGALGIADNPKGKRHPTIGNRVQIGAFSRIFGNISIGDDVFIGPQCVITEDIPSGSSVTIRPSTQVLKQRKHFNYSRPSV